MFSTLNFGALGGEQAMQQNISRGLSMLQAVFMNLLETWERSHSTTVVRRFAHGPPSRKQVKEMTSGFLKSLLDDGHQEGKTVVLNS